MGWKKVGSLRKSKKGGTYIKFDTAVSLDKDAVLQVQDPRAKLQESVEAGRLTEEKAEEILNKIPEYILREVFLVEN